MAQNIYDSEELTLGDRIDVSIDDQTGISDVQDITGDDKFAISIPTFKNIPLRIPKNKLVNIIYYRSNGMFSFTAAKVRDFVQTGMSLVEMQVKSPIKKMQRRDYVRHEKMMPIKLRVMAESAEDLKLNSDKIAKAIEEGKAEVIEGTTLDISGGGLRFASRYDLQAETILECEMDLGDKKPFTADCVVIKSYMRMKDGATDFVTSSKFINITENARNRIIKFIFDDQIRIRRKS